MRILNTVLVSGSPNILGWAIIALIAASLVVEAICVFTFKPGRKKDLIVSVCMLIFLLYLCLHFVCELLDVDPFSVKTEQYECVLDDGFFISDIPQEYKVVDVRGDIVVLEKSDTK